MARLKKLATHGWPGNVRELGNTVERLVLLSEGGKASADDLPEEMQAQPQDAGGFRLPAEGIAFAELERTLLSQALERTQGNRARAARLLRLPYKAFLYRLEKHGLG